MVRDSMCYGIAPGRYRLRVEKEGFQAYVREGVVVK